MCRSVVRLLVALGLFLLMTSGVQAANATYHSAGVNGAPDVGNWAWRNHPNNGGRPQSVHIWWMKQHWLSHTQSWNNMKVGDKFEMEWFNGGSKSNCDIFSADHESKVHFSSTAVALVGFVNECGGPAKEQVEVKIASKQRIPKAIQGVNNDGVSWAVVANAQNPIGPCAAPPPSAPSCPPSPAPETTEVNLEWDRGNLWLGKGMLSKCSGSAVRYRTTGSDDASPTSDLLQPTSC